MVGNLKEKNSALRRTASFSNIIRDVGDEEYEEEEKGDGEGKKNVHLSAQKGKVPGKLSILARGNYVKHSSLINGDKNYFQEGSSRNTARDADFFNYFNQFLWEVIQKLKNMEGNLDINQTELLLSRL